MRGRRNPSCSRCSPTSLRAPAPKRMAVGNEKLLMLMRESSWPCVRRLSDDFEIALQFPVGDAVQPLAPLPIASGREMFDKGITQEIPRDLRVAEVAGGFDQRA